MDRIILITNGTSWSPPADSEQLLLQVYSLIFLTILTGSSNPYRFISRLASNSKKILCILSQYS